MIRYMQLCEIAKSYGIMVVEAPLSHGASGLYCDGIAFLDVNIKSEEEKMELHFIGYVAGLTVFPAIIAFLSYYYTQKRSNAMMVFIGVFLARILIGVLFSGFVISEVIIWGCLLVPAVFLFILFKHLDKQKEKKEIE